MLDSTVCTPFPLDENLILWVTQISETGKTYYIVSDILRQEYSLWKGNKPTRYKSVNPLGLSKYVK